MPSPSRICPHLENTDQFVQQAQFVEVISFLEVGLGELAGIFQQYPKLFNNLDCSRLNRKN